MSIKPRFGFVIEYVKDIEASTHFYVEVLGLDVKRTHPTFVQFETFAIATDQPLASDGEAELYWLVDDAEAAFADLSPKARVRRPIQELPYGKVFVIDDPDGRPRCVLELAANRPSQQLSQA